MIYKKEGKKPAKIWGKANKKAGTKRLANKAVRKASKNYLMKHA